MLQSQESIGFGVDNNIRFDLDLVVYDQQTGQPSIVLDTKYKTPDAVSSRDVEQVFAYAEGRGCRETALVCPGTLSKSLDIEVGAIRVRAQEFPLLGDLDAAGNSFLASIGIGG